MVRVALVLNLQEPQYPAQAPTAKTSLLLKPIMPPHSSWTKIANFNGRRFSTAAISSFKSACIQSMHHTLVSPRPKIAIHSSSAWRTSRFLTVLMRSIVIPCLLVEWWRVDILREARWSSRIAPTIPQLGSGLCTLKYNEGMIRVYIINERFSWKLHVVDDLSKCRNYCEMQLIWVSLSRLRYYNKLERVHILYSRV